VDRRINCVDKSKIFLPKVIRVKEFNEEAAEKFSLQMSEAHDTGQPVIPILIDSYGGEVYSLLSMIADIESATIPVATICVGKAMSCGSVLLSCGTEGYRYIDKNATVMIHDVKSMQFGKTEELKAGVKQIDQLSKRIFGIMSKNCNQKENFFLNKIHENNHAEWYLTPSEAKKFNLIQTVGVPSFETQIKVKVKFGV